MVAVLPFPGGVSRRDSPLPEGDRARAPDESVPMGSEQFQDLFARPSVVFFDYGLL